MPTVTIDGKTLKLGPRDFVGQGGEADIYRLPGQRVAKIFKTPRHPDLRGNPNEQEGARRRLQLMQRKLLDFPKGLPPSVVAPLELIRSKDGSVIGYVMSFVEGADLLKHLTERTFREQQNVGISEVLSVMRGLHATVDGVHRAKAVIGDFNYLNVLFRVFLTGSQVWLIDADSMQWGPYPCIAYTQEFVDPLLCDPRASTLQMLHPHNEASDWYAFSIMLMRAALYVGPYGGVYKPRDVRKRMAPGARPLHRVTVFNKEVAYPKPAVPYIELPPTVLDYLKETFSRDMREPFPLSLLDEGLWSGRKVQVVAVLQPPATVQGKVTATVAFETEGRIVMAAIQNGKLLVLHHKDHAYLREDGSKVVEGAYDADLRYRLQGKTTLLAKRGQLMAITGDERAAHSVDGFSGLPMLDANAQYYYWLEGGSLKRSDALVGQRTVGDVLPGRTLLWVGDSFGLGLWYAGELQQAFVFDARSAGINSTVQIDRIPGQLINATTVFGGNLAWFLVEYQDNGQSHRRCTVVNSQGQVVSQVTITEPGEDHWLHTIHGHAAVDNMLFAATDQGIVSVRVESGSLATTIFEDTAALVTSASRLLAFVENKQIALMAVTDRQVVRLSINQ